MKTANEGVDCIENQLKRQTELDYAKTLAIFFMVIIHVLEELSCFGIEESLPSGFWENLVQFAAGPLAAPMFIFGWLTSFRDYLHIEPGFGGSAALGVATALVSIGITKLLPTIKW